MSLSNQNNYVEYNKNMSSEYKELPTGKIQCNKCQSILNKSGWNRHTKTARHLNGKINKAGNRYETMRATTNSIRERKIEEIGLEKVRENERLKKQKQRAKAKQNAKQNKQAIPEQKEQKEEKEEKINEEEHNNAIDEFRSASKQVQQIDNQKLKTHLKDVINKARSEVISGNTTIEQAKTLIKSKIKQFNADESKNNNCKIWTIEIYQNLMTLKEI